MGFWRKWQKNYFFDPKFLGRANKNSVWLKKMDSLTHFLSKNIYNDVLCINVSKVTAL